METTWWTLTVAVLLSGAVGIGLGWWLARDRASVRLVAAEAHRDLLLQRVADHEAVARDDQQVALQLAPLRATLARVEEGVRDLERDRAEQLGQVGARLHEVSVETAALRQQTATLTGALSSSATRGTWGELQLRRVLEHAGMLARCDFEEQVGGVSQHQARVRPDVVVRLPGERVVVIDAKAPMGAFLRAQADDVSTHERAALLRRHAEALRGHVESLAAKAYWSAFTTSPEVVICFVPSDAVLVAALHASPDLYDLAQSRRVVLASPAILLAVLRGLALSWQQDALTTNAQELLRLGTDLHHRLGTLGRHVSAMGSSLRRSVETYNALVGTLESRVMVTSRQMVDLDLASDPLPRLEAVEVAPRLLTAPELVSGTGGDPGDVAVPRGHHGGADVSSRAAQEMEAATPQRPTLLEDHEGGETRRHLGTEHAG